MANLQVRLNDDIKTQADLLFASLGLDTSTAVRMFLVAAIENGGIPFEVRHRTLSEGVQPAEFPLKFVTGHSAKEYSRRFLTAETEPI